MESTEIEKLPLGTRLKWTTMGTLINGAFAGSVIFREDGGRLVHLSWLNGGEIEVVKPRLDELPVGTIVQFLANGIPSQWLVLISKNGYTWLGGGGKNTTSSFSDYDTYYNDYITIWSPND